MGSEKSEYEWRERGYDEDKYRYRYMYLSPVHVESGVTSKGQCRSRMITNDQYIFIYRSNGPVRWDLIWF